MKSVNSKEAHNNFGDLMNQVSKGPILINKHGKPSAVLVAYDDYIHRDDAASKEDDLHQTAMILPFNKFLLSIPKRPDADEGAEEFQRVESVGREVEL